jgi:hypothetical protein
MAISCGSVFSVIFYHDNRAEPDQPLLDTFVGLADFVEPVGFRQNTHLAAGSDRERLVEILAAGPLSELAPVADWYFPTGAKGYTDFSVHAAR